MFHAGCSVLNHLYGDREKSNAMSETPTREADRGAKVPILRSRKPSVFLTETQSSFASVVLEFVLGG